RLPADESLAHLVPADLAAAEPGDDVTGELAGDLADARQGSHLGLGDPRIRIRELGRDLRLDRALFLVHFGRQGVAHALADRLRLAARLAQGPLVAAQGLFRLGLELIGLTQVALDPLAPLLDHLANAWQTKAFEQEIEQAKAEGEPDQLRGKRSRIERRERLG